MTENKDKKKGLDPLVTAVGGAVVGAALGAAFGNPDTRKKIEDTVDKAKKETEKRFHDIKSMASKTAGETKEKVDEQVDELEEKLNLKDEVA